MMICCTWDPAYSFGTILIFIMKGQKTQRLNLKIFTFDILDCSDFLSPTWLSWRRVLAKNMDSLRLCHSFCVTKVTRCGDKHFDKATCCGDKHPQGRLVGACDNNFYMQLESFNQLGRTKKMPSCFSLSLLIVQKTIFTLKISH